VANPPLKTRLECSVQAISLSWLLFGIVYCSVFCFLARAFDPIALWLLWGTALLVAGWFFIGLPLVALGDRCDKLSLPVVAIGTGLAGFLLGILLICVMSFLLTSSPNRAWSWIWTKSEYLFWGSPSFIVGAVTGCAYRILLCRSVLRLQQNQTSS
jgi:hypothetical protein